MSALHALRILLAAGFLERLSYFSTQAVLVLHMSLSEEAGGLGLSHGSALQLFEGFMQAAALAAVIGAGLAYFVAARRILIAGLVASALGHGLLAATPAIHVAVPLFFLAVGQGLFLPGLYLTLARRFSAIQSDKRDGAFAMLLVAMHLGTVGVLFGGLYETHLGGRFFVLPMLPVIIALLAVRRVRDSARTDPVLPGAATKAWLVLAACLTLEVSSFTRLSPSGRAAADGPAILSLLPEVLSGLVFGLAASFLWTRRDRQDPRSAEAAKVGLAGLALALALALSGLGDQRPEISIGESVSFSFYGAWSAAVALSVAASATPGRRAPVFLALWLLAEFLVLHLFAGVTAQAPLVWPAAVVAAMIAGILLAFRQRLRVG